MCVLISWSLQSSSEVIIIQILWAVCLPLWPRSCFLWNSISAVDCLCRPTLLSSACRGPSYRGGSRVTLDHVSERATSERAGQGENILHAWLFVSSANSPAQIFVLFYFFFFFSLMKTRSSDVLENPPPPPPPPPAPPCAGVIHLSSVGRLSSHHPPLVSDLHICVAAFHLLFYQRGCC